MKKIIILSLCLIGLAFCGDKKSEFDVGGMMCGNSCVKKINRAMDSIEGIKSREVNFEKSSMTVVYEEQLVTKEMIISALKENNYSCSIKKDEKSKKDSPIISFFKSLFN